MNVRVLLLNFKITKRAIELWDAVPAIALGLSARVAFNVGRNGSNAALFQWNN